MDRPWALRATVHDGDGGIGRPPIRNGERGPHRRPEMVRPTSRHAKVHSPRVQEPQPAPLRQLVEPDSPHFRHGPPPPEANNEFSVRVDPRRPFGDEEELLARVAIGGIEAEAVVADP